MNDKDLISVGLPTYNRAKCLPETLDIFLGQTYKNIEIIISDNASEDETQQICEAYAKKEPRVRYIRQSKNVGQMLNFRAVINEARGKYFMWAPDDDWFDSTYLEKLKKALDEHSEYGAAMGGHRRVQADNGSLIAETKFIGINDINNLTKEEQFLRTLIPGNKLYFFLYALFRTDLLRPLVERPFPDCIRFDHVLLAEAALVLRFYAIPEILYEKRIYRTGMAARYAGDPQGGAYTRKKSIAYLNYMYAALARVVSSPGVSLLRKIRVIVLVYPRFVAKLIPFIIFYCYPRTHAFLKKIKNWSL